MPTVPKEAIVGVTISAIRPWVGPGAPCGSCAAPKKLRLATTFAKTPMPSIQSSRLPRLITHCEKSYPERPPYRSALPTIPLVHDYETPKRPQSPLRSNKEKCHGEHCQELGTSRAQLDCGMEFPRFRSL